MAKWCEKEILVMRVRMKKSKRWVDRRMSDAHNPLRTQLMRAVQDKENRADTIHIKSQLLPREQKNAESQLILNTLID